MKRTNLMGSYQVKPISVRGQLDAIGKPFLNVQGENSPDGVVLEVRESNWPTTKAKGPEFFRAFDETADGLQSPFSAVCCV